uniref:Putative ovule protein n=1 Tax=Solanum chacoense TaxID=4108 RepID=A0A0V0IW70_SOLCH
MDSVVEIQPEIGSDGVGEKRLADDVELEEPAPKKARGVVIGNTKKVAEMVLVLAALGKIRGGRVPTAAEREMMTEARENLAQVCQSFAPKDVFPRDSFGAVIEDLGLNKLKDQRLGFRPPKVSIAEKLQIAKEKLEKTEEFSVPAATYSSQRPQSNMAATIENRGPSHVRMFPHNKASHVVNPSGSFQSASPLVHGTPASSAPLPYQLPTSEVRPVISSGVVSGNPVRDSSLVALPRVDRPSFRMDGRPNGSSHMLQVQATSGDHSTIRTPTWSVQPASVAAAKRGPDTRVTAQTGNKVEGGTDAKSQMTASRPFITQTTAGNLPTTHPHLQGASFVKSPPLSSTHAEIGKIVQKFIQPRLSERPAWTPPSRDYISKALTCQMCKSTVNEVDNVLVCDACEKGYHLKCLQMTNQKGAPRGEWHCGKCLSITNGKPLPPKYGRVMRNINSSKMPTIAAIVQSSPDRKAFGPDEKVRQLKIMRNGNVSLQNSTTNGMSNSLNQLPSAPKMQNDQRMGGTDNVSGKGNVESRVASAACSSNLTLGICSNNLAVSSNDNSFSPASSMISFEQKVVEVKSQPPAIPETVSISFDHSQALNHLQANSHAQLANSVEIPSQQFPGSLSMVGDAKESSARAGLANSSSDECKRENQGVERTNLVETPIARNGDAECVSSTSNLFHSVDWVGDVLQVADEKHYYQSCRHNGFIYNVQEYVVIRFEDERVIPSKLLAMWEDIKAGKKWVTVNRCYFPRDLPHAVGHPCSLESNEVYLSNCSTTVMAGQIQGPCEVLPLSKFNEERERVSRLETGPNGGLQPLYLCKWIYDESKGLFRDVSC